MGERASGWSFDVRDNGVAGGGELLRGRSYFVLPRSERWMSDRLPVSLMSWGHDDSRFRVSDEVGSDCDILGLLSGMAVDLSLLGA